MTLDYPDSCDKVQVRCKSTDLAFNVHLLNHKGYHRGVECLRRQCRAEFREQGLDALLQQWELPALASPPVRQGLSNWWQVLAAGGVAVVGLSVCAVAASSWASQRSRRQELVADCSDSDPGEACE
eukprot:gb/GFBE01048479.1/.p1 GENE.gb/GFBE01048479.1/~~gb/GFBE01048479.1/.p1  ORF type:complete len:126 (+),score=21.72 gb/GFBE01048479.1/:1-378(+)